MKCTRGCSVILDEVSCTTWDPVNDDAACPRGGGRVRDPQGCTPEDGTSPVLLYNAACCCDGRVGNHVSLC